MKKQIFTLFTKTLLVAVCLLGETSSAWANYSPTSDEIIILNSVYNASATSAGYSNHSAIQWGGTASSSNKKAGDPNNGGAATSSNVACYSVKGNGGGKNIDFVVTNVTGLIIYHESHSSRNLIVKNGSTTIVTGSNSTYYTMVTGLDAKTNYTLRLEGTDGSGQADFYVYAIKLITPAATVAPTITSDLASSADVYVGVAHDFSITATGATSYQWYKASSTTADIENDDAIDGATSSSYSYTAASAGTEYLYCAATNAIGTTPSTVCVVTATVGTSHSVTYSLGDATGGTAPTQADVTVGGTFTVAAAPGDLVAPSGKEFKCWNDGDKDYNAGATYTMGDDDVTLTAVYQDRAYKGLTPTSTLDLSNAASTTFTTKWYTSNTKENCYYDAPNGVVTFSPYAIYQSSASQTWAKANNGNSTGSTWDATGVFKGSSYYFSSSAKAATMRNTERMYYYRVKNCTGVSVLVGGKALIEAYQVIDDVVTADPVKNNSINAAGTLSLTSLDKDKEYIIKVYGNDGNTNVVYNEIAFNFPAVTSVSAKIGATGWTTFASAYPLNLTTLTASSGTATAYYASTAKGSSVTMTSTTATVRAGVGLALKGTPNATVTIPVAASGAAIEGNKLKGCTTSTVLAANSNYYVLVNNNNTAEFQRLDTNGATIPAGKAYLDLTGVSLAPTLSIVFEDETSGIDEVRSQKEGVKGAYYNLAGQRVAQPIKGLYIVNGRKVVVK